MEDILIYLINLPIESLWMSIHKQSLVYLGYSAVFVSAIIFLSFAELARISGRRPKCGYI